MNIDPRIYGYVGDGFLACPKCAEAIAFDAGTEHLDLDPDRDTAPDLAEYEAADLSPLGSHHDTTPCGETCDCGKEIFEEADDHGIEEACSSCGYFVPALWAVLDARRIVLGRFQTEGQAEDHIFEAELVDVAVVELPYDDTTGIGGRIPHPNEVPLFEVVAELSYDPREEILTLI